MGADAHSAGIYPLNYICKCAAIDTEGDTNLFAGVYAIVRSWRPAIKGKFLGCNKRRVERFSARQISWPCRLAEQSSRPIGYVSKIQKRILLKIDSCDGRFDRDSVVKAFIVECKID